MAGATVSVDLNYRAKLWKWGKSAGDVMADLVAEADVLVGNEEDAEQVFGIHASGSAVADGKVEAAGYATVATQLAERFPRLHTIAFTQRGSISASENTWSGVLWTREGFHVARSYRIVPIVDRVGAGDAFAAGLIYATLDGRAPDAALEFAVAASCLKHTIRGDANAGQRGRGRRAGARIRVGTGRAMTLSARLEVLTTIVETGVLPLFYADDADRASRITGALREGGARAIEFTDRGPGRGPSSRC